MITELEIEMQCKCIEEVSKKLADFVKSDAGDDVKAQLKHIGWDLSKGCETVINIPFIVTGSKRGYTSAKGKEIMMRASFCPFCGVSTKKPEAGQST
ncbi:hypothetical protein ACO0LB_18590 [Undibacterium sp. SXout7W]|uniref:hypothetical protein n=1 Tax=Undibacterium sp. SXout7W TaxID=3413049 RepID=UPI003BF14F7E